MPACAGRVFSACSSVSLRRPWFRSGHTNRLQGHNEHSPQATGPMADFLPRAETVSVILPVCGTFHANTNHVRHKHHPLCNTHGPYTPRKKQYLQPTRYKSVNNQCKMSRHGRRAPDGRNAHHRYSIGAANLNR